MFACRISSCTTFTSSPFPLRYVAYVRRNVCQPEPPRFGSRVTSRLPTLAKERAANGHPAPYKIALLGIGNESWDCGGNMTPTTI